MRTLRAGEIFALYIRIAVELANKVCCWLGLLCWTSALPGRSKNCKLEKGIPGGFAPAVSCEGGS